MIGKTKEDKAVKQDILKKHTLEGIISLNKDTFYRVGTVPCIAVFTAGEPHPADKIAKFINFEDDGFEVKKHLGLVETERAKDKRQYLLDCWRGKVAIFRQVLWWKQPLKIQTNGCIPFTTTMMKYQQKRTL